jgi:transcription elongation factor GreA
MKDVLLTKEGIEKLKAELEKLINVDRQQVVEKIKEARAYGDFSENAEYDAARDEQSMIEGRIEELEALLKKARVVDAEKAGRSDRVGIGATVEVEVEGDMETYRIVGSAESDPSTGQISIESPLGKALLGAKPGETVSVTIPDGSSIKYKIVKIN